MWDEIAFILYEWHLFPNFTRKLVFEENKEYLVSKQEEIFNPVEKIIIILDKQNISSQKIETFLQEKQKINDFYSKNKVHGSLQKQFLQYMEV